MQAKPRITWLGNVYFSHHLAELGFDVRYCDIRGRTPLTWPEVLEIGGGEPDVLVLADSSLPPMLAGVEDFPCLSLLYSVDSHIHSWQPAYAQAFDACVVSMRDHVRNFSGARLAPENIIWLPLFAKQADAPREAEKIWDLLFVGSTSQANHPIRAEFLTRLAQVFPGLVVKKGDYRELYPQARLVLNQAEALDLNFRVFEALGCGACLLTPAVGHGLSEIFSPGRELFTYEPGDAAGLAALAFRLLDRPKLTWRVAQRGLAKVNAGHRAIHRALSFSAWLRGLDSQRLRRERQNAVKDIRRFWLRMLYLHWAEAHPDPAWREIYLGLARA